MHEIHISYTLLYQGNDTYLLDHLSFKNGRDENMYNDLDIPLLLTAILN